MSSPRSPSGPGSASGRAARLPAGHGHPRRAARFRLRVRTVDREALPAAPSAHRLERMGGLRRELGRPSPVAGPVERRRARRDGPCGSDRGPHPPALRPCHPPVDDPLREQPRRRADPRPGGWLLGRAGRVPRSGNARWRPICVRFVFSEFTRETFRFEQAFSADEGRTWEVNWVSTFTRVKG